MQPLQDEAGQPAAAVELACALQRHLERVGDSVLMVLDRQKRACREAPVALFRAMPEMPVDHGAAELLNVEDAIACVTLPAITARVMQREYVREETVDLVAIGFKLEARAEG